MNNKKQLIYKAKNKFFRFNALKAYQEAIDYESLSIKNKIELDWKARKELVHYAYDHNKFYRKFYDEASFHPDLLLTEADWDKVPVVEKEMIRNNLSDFISDGVTLRQLREATTGGSTGKPLKVYKDKEVFQDIIGWRTLSWWNLNPYDNYGVVNRSVPKGRINRIKNFLLWWPTRRAFLDASSVNEENIRKFIADINRLKAKRLVGYCGSLEKISDYILQHNLKVETLEMVWSTTSPLTPSVRKKMEAAFQCQIMDQYGSVEVFHIAVQRPGEDYLTVNSDYIHVDIVDENNSIITDTGQMGDILTTDLHSHKFPLIKYRLGDRSRMLQNMSESKDGFPRIDFVRGRISDMVNFRDGSYLDGAFLTTICDGYEDVVDSYQIYQDKDYNLFFKIVRIAGIEEENKRLMEVIDNFYQLVNKRAAVEIQFVDSIPDDRGKRRFIISDAGKIN